MPTPPKHTALPWSQGKGNYSNCLYGNNRTSVLASVYYNTRHPEEAEANAALIVHRVNAFEGLVEALENIANPKNYGGHSGEWITDSDPCEIATAALKQAKEG